MAKGFDNIYAKSAVKSHNRFDLSRSHLTTLNIGQIIPIFNEEVVPGDNLNVKSSYFARLEALAKPTYGKLDFKTATMYVPYHQVAEDAEAFFAGKTTWQGQVPVTRYFTIADYARLYIDSISTANPLITVVTTDPSPAWYDFTYIDASGNRTWATFTPLGRYVEKFMSCLGYMIPQNITIKTGNTWETTGVGSTKLSAYPFLATIKAYNDWMSQSQRYNSSVLSDYLLKIRQGKDISSYYTASTGHLTAGCIFLMMLNVKLCYDNDYFTSAWQRANAPLQSADGVLLVDFPSAYTVLSPNMVVTRDAAGTRTNFTTGGTSNVIHQRQLDFLKAFDDWVRRNNYAGSRDVQQVYARFGIKTDEYKTHFAEVCGTSSTPIQIGDVTATTSYGGNQALGDYAGKGIINSDGAFNVKCSDFGLVVTLAWIAVRPVMPYGFDRKVLKHSSLDWFNPEFDAIGPQVISYQEAYENPKATADPSPGNEIYGFTERYNEYKFGRDQVTGDFKQKRANDVWHFARDLSDVRKAYEMVAQSASMVQVSPTSEEFLRIFTSDSNANDHFYITAYHDVNAMRPMLNLSQSARLGDGNTVIAKNGNTIN